MSPELTIRQPLTAERLRELADRGLSQTEIATETGYSRQRVNHACRQFGIEPTKKPWSPPAEHQQRATAARLAKGAGHIEAIRQCAADGMTATQAAAKLGTTRAAVYNATRRYEIEFVKERKPKRNLTGKSRAGKLRRQRAYMARRNAKLKADGVCVKCAVAPVVRHRPKCAACALADTEREKLRQANIPKPAAKPKPAPALVAKPPMPKPQPAAKPPMPDTRLLPWPPCAICGHKMSASTAAAQVRLHPGITVYPRCRACDQRIAQSVQGIRSARAARQDGEGDA